MKNLILEAQNLRVDFSEKTVLNDLNFDLEKGSFLSIVGENGVGKTTFIKVLLDEIKPSSGKVNFLPDRKQVKIGYVPQFRNIDDEYPLSIKDFIALNFNERKLPWLSIKERKTLNHVLKQTKLEKIKNEPLGKASGGEKQRVYLAQALVMQPNLLILDESTASLDPASKEDLLNLIKELNREENLTIIFVTHDIQLAKNYADKYLFLKSDGYEQGQISKLKEQEFWEDDAHV
ncbi:ATP-binding cassette domain-containing protein [Lactobacillus sp. S2-2]|uniref:metal ABC transporter ATP-binding protein n=1 Tax=Lactobacillus sp. S2-2 TaxID=2692917 RepID=UPI001F31B4A7|nr:ABC transporter ATP-binding protein [Lactobacillus sp. S2-2]MCF6515853.1 ATP-binding cassette domain-containing protein [Lactobacillus sp. S2-2]